MISSSSSAGLISSSLAKSPSPPGQTATSYPFSFRIQVSVCTNEASSSATSTRVAGAAILVSGLEQRGIDVAATHHQHGGARARDEAIEQCGRRRGTRRLDREPPRAPQKLHGGADAGILDQHYAANPVALPGDFAEGHLADVARVQSAGDAAGPREPHHFPCGERTMQLGRADGLDPPDDGLTLRSGKARDDAGDEAAPAYGNDHRLHIGQL